MNRGWRFCRQGQVLYVVDSSCILVGPPPSYYPVLGRYCSQVVPKLIEPCASESLGITDPSLVLFQSFAHLSSVCGFVSGNDEPDLLLLQRSWVTPVDHVSGACEGRTSRELLGRRKVALPRSDKHVVAIHAHSDTSPLAVPSIGRRPSGDRDRQLGSGLVDYGLNVITQHRFDDRLVARLNGGLVLAGNTQTGAAGIKERGTVITGGASLVRQFGTFGLLGGEVTFAWSEKATLAGSLVGTQVGGNVRLRDGWTLDLSVGTGWFDASPRLSAQVGLSIDPAMR